MSPNNHKPGIINCHTHIITSRNLPNQLFLYPLPIIWLLREIPGFRFIVKLLLNPLGWLLGRLGFSKLERKLERVGPVAEMSSYKEQKEVLEKLIKYYSKRTKFVLLSLDTLYMEKGKPSQSFEDQLDELSHIKTDPEFAKKIFSFIHADPRRENVTELVIDCLEKRGFLGIKIYPPFGIHPSDPRLDDIYEYAQKRGVPIIGHCTPDGLRGKVYKDGSKIFADPDNYLQLLERYPLLKLCLAHFGGNTEWDKYLNDPWKEGQEMCWVSKIIDMIKLDNGNRNPKYPNLYADISYTASYPQMYAYLKILLEDKKLKERIIFGTDFYVVQLEMSERAFSIGLRGYLGEEKFDQIARKNPREFLGIH